MPIKQLVAIRRKAGLTQAEFSRYVREVHGDLAKARPLGISRYTQNHAFDGAYGTADDPTYAGISHRDLVTELWFADPAAMERTFSDSYSRETVREDGKNFNDFPSATVALVREETLEVAAPGDGDCKVFYYLKARDGRESDAFEKAVVDAHRSAVAAAPAVAATLRACVRNVPLRGGAANAHFGGADMPTFDTVLMLRFADETAGAAFRTYQRAFEAAMGDALDRSRSFFTVTREVVIFDSGDGVVA